MNNIKYNLSNKEKKKLANDIKNLTKLQQIEIFKIIKNNTNKYTLNNNGIFINMNCLSTALIYDLQQFINFSNDSKEKLKKQEKLLKDNIICFDTDLYKNDNIINEIDENNEIFEMDYVDNICENDEINNEIFDMDNICENDEINNEIFDMDNICENDEINKINNETNDMNEINDMNEYSDVNDINKACINSEENIANGYNISLTKNKPKYNGIKAKVIKNYKDKLKKL
jgi:hypothetical protein